MFAKDMIIRIIGLLSCVIVVKGAVQDNGKYYENVPYGCPDASVFIPIATSSVPSSWYCAYLCRTRNDCDAFGVVSENGEPRDCLLWDSSQFKGFAPPLTSDCMLYFEVRIDIRSIHPSRCV